VEKRHASPALQEAHEGLRHSDAAARQSTPAKAGKPARIAAAQPKHAPDGPRFNELRKEMRALLTILGAEESETSSVSAPGKPKKKLRENSNEPTLF
ncbi:MAG: hypothetical protein WA700_12195, partial [Acidobacteriaceae bacterium]